MNLKNAKQAVTTSDLSGRSSPVNVTETSEKWSECELEDGTKLKIKPVIIDVRRLEGQYSQDGNPIYIIKSALVTDIQSPETLKKDYKKG